MSSDHGVKVADDFEKYLRTGDASLVENYSAAELKTAVGQLSPYYDQNKQWYREIKRRIEELENKGSSHSGGFLSEESREKWIERLVIFGLGILVGMLF